MNVTCDKCNKRYSIADEKVRGKSVKIRCKQCQNLISVQGPPDDGLAAPSGAVASAPMQAVQTVSAISAPPPTPITTEYGQHERTRQQPAIDYSPVWYAMVKGKQLGPMSVKDMEPRVKAGEISLRTYLWKQGMVDWKRASDVPDVAPVFAGVSVGAAATGPVTSSAPVVSSPTSPERPASKSVRPVQRDVATANEMPSPELTSRPASPRATNGNGHPAMADVTAQQPALQPTVPGRVPTGTQSGVRRSPSPSGMRPAVGAATASASGVAPAVASVTAPQPALQPEPVAIPAPAASEKAPLNDLFNDSDAPLSGQTVKPASTDPGEDGSTDPRAAQTESPSANNNVDPFAALGEADPSMAPPPGEATKFFIAQAGVNKRNPPWKIALFGMGMLGLPIALLYLLSTLHIVPLEVKRTDENGQEVSQPFFSGEGLVGLKDMLTGEEKRRRESAKQKAEAKAKAEVERKVRERNNPSGAGVANVDPNQMPDRKDNKPAFSDEELKKLYGVSGNNTGSPVNLDSLKGDVKVKVRPVMDEKPVVSDGSGLSAKAVSETVGKSQNAFQLCIEQALHKNPNMKVGKVTLVVEVGASGAVKSSSFEQKTHEMSEWGICLKDRARRMVFPKSQNDEETRVEIPLVVGVAMQ